MQPKKQPVAHKHIFSITALIIGAVFSLFLVVGRSIRLLTDFKLITAAPWKAVLFFVLFWAIFTVLLTLLYFWMDSLEIGKTSSVKGSAEGSAVGSVEGIGAALKDFKHPVLMRMLLILLMWLPFQIWFMPGNVPADPWRQLNMFLGHSYWHTHHPFVATVTTGSIYWLGMQIGGKNMGAFFCFLVQDLAGAFAYASMIAYVHRKSQSRVLSIVSLLFVGIVPLFPGYVMSLGKDSLYLTYLTLFLLSYVKILLKDEGRYTWIVLVFFGALACMQRHDAIYLVVPTAFVLPILVTGKEMKKRALLWACLILLGAASERLFVSKVLGLHSDSKTEALSLPLQQIGRYVMKHEGELTPEEIETIDAVLVYEGMAERYQPRHSNGIKNHWRKEATKEDWSNLYKFWAEKMLEDPLTYAESIGNSMLGYVDPVYSYTQSLDLYNYTAEGKAEPYATYLFPESTQEAVRSYVKFWRGFPSLKIFMSPASYFWVYIVLLGAVLRKRKIRKLALLFVLPVLSFAICIASPISGSSRYAMPVIVALPLYLLIILLYYRAGSMEQAHSEG